MKAFAALYLRLDATTSSNAKLEALRDYFATAPAEDAAWAVYFLAGGRPRQLVPTRLLRELATAMAGLPDWLFEESYQAVGDLAETISLLLPQHAEGNDEGLAAWVENHLLPLRGLPPEQVRERLPALWAQLERPSLMLCLKLITGSFRVGVSKLLVTRALAQLVGLDAKRVAQRLVGYTDISHRPSAASYHKLVAEESADEHSQRGGQPYPFFLAHPLQVPSEQFDALLGPPSDWQIEWKWDGIRAQVVKREGQLWVWSRGEELVTERFPELHCLAQTLPDGVVLDARSWCGSRASHRRNWPCSHSRCCSSALAAKPWARSCWPTRLSCCKPTTCWSGKAKIGAADRSMNAAPSCNAWWKNTRLPRSCCRHCSKARTGPTLPASVSNPAALASRA